MQRLEKLVFKKYKHKGKTYTIYFEITDRPKYGCIDIVIGVRTVQRTQLGRHWNHLGVFFGNSRNSVQEAIDNAFKGVDCGLAFFDDPYNHSFDDYKLGDKIKKLLK